MNDRRIAAQFRRPSDTPELIEDRQRRGLAMERVRSDMAARFPVITTANAAEAVAFQSSRSDFHLAQARGIPIAQPAPLRPALAEVHARNMEKNRIAAIAEELASEGRRLRTKSDPKGETS